MFKALTDLMDHLFKPVNAFFSNLLGGAPPAQGGSVFNAEGRSTGLVVEKFPLVERLPDFVIDGAPTPLTGLRIPVGLLSARLALSPILWSENESRKEI